MIFKCAIESGQFFKKSIVKRLQPQGIKCLVKNIETQTLYYKAFPLGFDYFQGNFFSKPALVEKKDVPISKFNFLEMLIIQIRFIFTHQ